MVFNRVVSADRAVVVAKSLVNDHALDIGRAMPAPPVAARPRFFSSHGSAPADVVVEDRRECVVDAMPVRANKVQAVKHAVTQVHVTVLIHGHLVWSCHDVLSRRLDKTQ